MLVSLLGRAVRLCRERRAVTGEDRSAKKRELEENMIRRKYQVAGDRESSFRKQLVVHVSVYTAADMATAMIDSSTCPLLEPAESYIQ